MWIHNTSLIKSFSLVKCPIHNPEKLHRSDRIRISDPGIRKKYKSGFVQYWTVLIACSVCVFSLAQEWTDNKKALLEFMWAAHMGIKGMVSTAHMGIKGMVSTAHMDIKGMVSTAHRGIKGMVSTAHKGNQEHGEC